MNWVAGEVKNPGRALPIALVASVVLVCGLYVSANAAFVHVLGPLAIANLAPSVSVGVATVEALFGATWRAIAAGFSFASVAATLHVTILCVARVTFAFSRGPLGFAPLGRLTPYSGVPVNAVLASAIACILVVVGSSDKLTDYFIFNAWVFYVAAGVAMFVLRVREPAMPRPYRTLGYPLIPAVYVRVGTWLVVETLISSTRASLIGLAIVALSFPVYYVRSRSRSRSPNRAS